MHTKILARAWGGGWWGSNPQVNFNHCAFLLIQANITGREGGLHVRKGLQSQIPKNTLTVQKSTKKWCKYRFHELLVLWLIQYWQTQRLIRYDKHYDTKFSLEKVYRWISVFRATFQGIKIVFIHIDWNSAALVYCHSPVLELPPCLRAHVQHSFPGLTVYSNYQANKGPPCAVIGKGRWVGSRMRGYDFGKCVW